MKINIINGVTFYSMFILVELFNTKKIFLPAVIIWFQVTKDNNIHLRTIIA